MLENPINVWDFQYSVLLMSPPFNVSATIPNNIYMMDLAEENRIINKSLALRQWMRIYSFLSNNALVYLLPTTDQNLQDQVYVANAGSTLPHLEYKNIFIASRFKSEPRKGEERVIIDFMNSLGYSVIYPPKEYNNEPLYFEGKADLFCIDKKNHIYLSQDGIRTNRVFHRWLEKYYNCEVITINLDPRESEYLYHTDCIVCQLSGGDKSSFLIYEGVGKEILEKLEKYADLTLVTKEEFDLASAGITNSIRVKNNLLTASDINFLNKETEQQAYNIEKRKIEKLEKICSNYGLNLVVFDLGEFMKSGALLSCIVNDLTQYDG